MNSPSGGMSVLFKQAKILSENGYVVKFLYQGNEVFNPTWMDFDISHIEKIKINSINSFRFNNDDTLIIPEGFGNIIYETRNTKYNRIVFAQSWIYILSSLPKPMSWKDCGITKVITISDGITDYINNIMPGLDIYQYKQSISNIFKPNINKEFKVCYSATRSNIQHLNVINLINNIKLNGDIIKNVQFIELKNLNKLDFSNLLSECIFCLYTDEIAGFGTLPLEAMACNTHVIGFKNIGNKEYVKDNNGFWCQNGNYFDLYDLLKESLINYVNNFDYSNLIKNEINTSSLYNENNEQKKILEIFNRVL
jgi:hypothetical protein